MIINEPFKAHVYQQFAELRAVGPIHRAQFHSGITGWLVVDHDLAREALTHPALLKNAEPATEMLESAGFLSHKPGVGLGGQMLESDPPEHTRLRRLVSGAFTPRRAAGLAPRIEQVAHELIDAMPLSGELDLVDAFTAPLPMTVIAELLGIPKNHAEDFRHWTAIVLDVAHPEHGSALANLHELLHEIAEDKRKAPQDDLLSALVAVRDEADGRLSDDELSGTAALLVIAGHETTVNLLGNATLALLRHPDQLALLRSTPELMAGAVEELLRYDTSVERTTNRYAAEDLELGGALIPRGSIVAVALASVNRDIPLPDGTDPDVLDITRQGSRHLSFGHGIHHCLGAPLARLEAAIALRTLLSRMRRMELAVPAESLSWIPVGMMRGPRSLPVRYSLN
ncbi:cytochrome P450 [Streptomyces tendae]|uniref:cytochrome P450 family protein n=1 Tax=Streptomyces tendae TaxID=1932 RepID=UPI0033CEEB41